jgi:translation initiation factor 2 subunit 1
LDSIKNVPDDVKEAFLKIADENVKITTVDITGKIKLSFNADNGIDLIKDSLKGAKDLIESKEFRSLSIHYLGAPYYRIEIISKDYLDAESILSDALEYIENKAKSHNGTFEFIRD